MGCFQVRYVSRIVIYERKLFIRLATGFIQLCWRPRCSWRAFSDPKNMCNRISKTQLIKIWFDQSNMPLTNISDCLLSAKISLNTTVFKNMVIHGLFYFVFSLLETAS